MTVVVLHDRIQVRVQYVFSDSHLTIVQRKSTTCRLTLTDFQFSLTELQLSITDFQLTLTIVQLYVR